MNTGAPWPGFGEAEQRVRVMQTKRHRWATADAGRCFEGSIQPRLYDPAFLVVAWRRVRTNKGARTAGVDGVKPRSFPPRAEKLLVGLRDDVGARRFVPQRVRQETIPKSSGKVRSLGIPTVGDRIVQASLKLVLEPIFEADFKPCSYGFRPKPSRGEPPTACRGGTGYLAVHLGVGSGRPFRWDPLRGQFLRPVTLTG